MARQGNYVTLPGASANWGAGLSASLADLSKTFINQANNEKERERLAAEAEESKRRFGITEARQKAADEATTDYRRQQLENAAEQARLTAENRAKTLDLQAARDAISIKKADADEAERKRLEGIRTNLEGYSSNFGYSDLEQYDPALAKKIANAGGFEAIDNVVSKAEALFDTKSDKFMPNRVNEYISAVEQQRGEELTPQQREEMATALETQMRPLYALREEDRGRFKEDVLGLLGIPALQESKQSFIERAPTALTEEEAVKFHTSRLMNAGVPRTEALKEAEAIATINGRKSYGDILAERTASAEAQKEAYEAQKEELKDFNKFQLDLLKEIGTGSSSSGFKGSDPINHIEKLLKDGGIHPNADTNDVPELVNRYKALIASGYKPDIAMAATTATFDPGFTYDNMKPIAEAKQFAEDLLAMRKTSGTPNSGLRRELLGNLETQIAGREVLNRPSFGPDMDAWRAGRWGDRARAALYGLGR
jgi:hypothetical protein